MNKENILKLTDDHVKNILKNESTGHDWWHIDRVRKNALKIAKEESADLFVVEMASLLHDIGDRKVTGLKDDSIEPAKSFLDSTDMHTDIKERILEIIDKMSFSKNIESMKELSIEGKVVQDADRLDAIGAIGIARCFAFGGKKSRVLYDPERMPENHVDLESYKKSTGSSINHFYEKLLLLKNLMNTETGKRMAEERHNFMEAFLKKFFSEWECN